MADPDNTLGQVIDGDGQLTNEFERVLAKWGYASAAAASMAYRIVAVLGAQSSGKSTLLNKLFLTQFEVMDDQRGRQQTTKGTPGNNLAPLRTRLTRRARKITQACG